jgi:hypothetical protein
VIALVPTVMTQQTNPPTRASEPCPRSPVRRSDVHEYQTQRVSNGR